MSLGTSRICVVEIALMALLLACTSPEGDWTKANTLGTVAAYEAFLAEHPQNSHADEARARINSLQDDQVWADAHNTNTVESYQQYLQKQPKGTHIEEARGALAAFERTAAWKTAQTDGTESSLQGFLQKYPQGPEADQARAQLQKLNARSSRVQLAEFRSKKEAERVRARLQKHYGKVLPEIDIIPGTPPTKLNRVVSAPMSLDEAQSACATLKKVHQHCEVVKN